MPKVLMLYGSRYGQTWRIARRIGDRLGEHGHDVEVVDAGQGPAPAELEVYGLVIIGAPIYAGRYPREVISWLRKALDQLQALPGAFFNVSGSACSPDPRGREQALAHAHNFLAASGWSPSRVEAFAGAIPYTRYNALTRFMMKRIIRRAGGEADTSRDYEYTSWELVDDYADELTRLTGSGVGQSAAATHGAGNHRPGGPGRPTA